MTRFRRYISGILAMCILVCCFQISASGEAFSEKREKQNLEDAIQAELTQIYGSETYTVDVKASYYSKEYLTQLQFNSRKTNWFGGYLDEINLLTDGQKWVFTVNEEGNTTIELFRENDTTYSEALTNMAIGTGVILICVTISVVSAGAGAPAISAIFAVSAKTAAMYGVSSGAVSSVIAGTAAAVQTGGDMDAVMHAAALSGSSSFMWGAISGAAIGGASEAIALHSATASGLTMNQAAAIRNETGWSLETISRIKNDAEYQIYRNAGLRETVINGRTMLVRDIDLNYQSMLGDKMVTNLERMSLGKAPIDPATGMPYQLHHVNQDIDGVLAVLTTAEHQGNAAILNTYGMPGVQSTLTSSVWKAQREAIWKAFAASLAGI